MTSAEIVVRYDFYLIGYCFIWPLLFTRFPMKKQAKGIVVRHDYEKEREKKCKLPKEIFIHC